MEEIRKLVKGKELIVRKRIVSFLEKIFKYLGYEFRHDNYKCDNSTHLSLFEVKKSFRGKYIGTEVIDELKNTITSKGRIFTTSGIDMYEEKRPITENFYMRLGFKELTLEDGTKYLKYTA